MNRRGFFHTLLAAAAAIFLPKSKKAETVVGVDPAAEGGDNSVVFYDTLDGGNYFYGNDEFLVSEDSKVGDMFYSFNTTKTRIYDGNSWILVKENQNG